MIEFRHPLPGEEPQLRRLWMESFGESDSFIELFITRGYEPRRCMAAFEGAELAGVLYWFDCTLGDAKIAYIYGVATAPGFRHRGIASGLLEWTHSHLEQTGYVGAILVPGGPGLFRFYGRIGYQTVGTIDEFWSCASEVVPVRALSAPEYLAERNRFLPENGVRHDLESLEFFQGFARFYRGEDFVAAVSAEEALCYELLGNRESAGGLLAALGLPKAKIRSVGIAKPFAMARWFGPYPHRERVHFGLAFD